MEPEKLDNLVAQAFEIRKGRSGSVGLTLDLGGQGHTYNRKTMTANMRRQGLVTKAARKLKATTDSDHHLPLAPSHLEQDFSADSPGQKWVRDALQTALLRRRMPKGLIFHSDR